MDTASLEINGSYLAYAYLVLLQFAVVYLQRPDQARLLGRDSSLPRFYSTVMGFVGTGLNWFSWLFSAYIGREFGIPSGVLFFALGMGPASLQISSSRDCKPSIGSATWSAFRRRSFWPAESCWERASRRPLRTWTHLR